MTHTVLGFFFIYVPYLLLFNNIKPEPSKCNFLLSRPFQTRRIFQTLSAPTSSSVWSIVRSSSFMQHDVFLDLVTVFTNFISHFARMLQGRNAGSREAYEYLDDGYKSINFAGLRCNNRLGAPQTIKCISILCNWVLQRRRGGGAPGLVYCRSGKYSRTNFCFDVK
jgi:hypothetical protein